MSFNSDGLKSYGTTVARFVTNPAGEEILLISERSFSATTAKHLGRMRYAANHKRTLSVWFVSNDGWNHADCGNDVDSIIDANILHYLTEARSYVDKATTHRNPRSREKAAREFAHNVRRANEIATAFNRPTVDAEFSAVATQIDATLAASAERERLAREQREADSAKRTAILKAQEAEQLPAWLAGEINGSCYYQGSDFLRVDPNDPETIETTRGARVPTAHVRRAIRLIGARLTDGLDYANLNVHIGHYTLTNISGGKVYVGCHTFTVEEIERFRQVLDAQPVSA